MLLKHKKRKGVCFSSSCIRLAKVKSVYTSSNACTLYTHGFTCTATLYKVQADFCVSVDVLMNMKSKHTSSQ